MERSLNKPIHLQRPSLFFEDYLRFTIQKVARNT
jgi:hypothetical protein